MGPHNDAGPLTTDGGMLCNCRRKSKQSVRSNETEAQEAHTAANEKPEALPAPAGLMHEDQPSMGNIRRLLVQRPLYSAKELRYGHPYTPSRECSSMHPGHGGWTVDGAQWISGRRSAGCSCRGSQRRWSGLAGCILASPSTQTNVAAAAPLRW
jgi:hypothetical protein